MTTSCYFFPFSALSSLHSFVCLLSFFFFVVFIFPFLETFQQYLYFLLNVLQLLFFICCLPYFPFIPQHWALWKRAFVFFSVLHIFDHLLFPHFTLFGKPKPEYGTVLVWTNHSMHFIKVVFLSFVPFICLTIAYPDFYWICVTKTTTCIRFYFSLIISTNISDYSYVFMFYTNTSIHNILSSLLSNFPFSLHHVCFARVVRLWFVEDYTKGKSPFSMEIVLQDKEVLYHTINVRHFFSFLNFFSYHVIL